MTIHGMVFCWPGQEQNTIDIVRALSGHVERLTVIDATASAIPSLGQCDWVKVDPRYYFGMKFCSALKVFDGDVLLQVQADASCDDWPALAARCRHAFGLNGLGIWAPDVNYSRWNTDVVHLADTDDPNLKLVTQTDCIVWAMSRAVAGRMRRLDYTKNNLGWGVDWAAIAYCYASKLAVIRDISICVRHPQSTGYAKRTAAEQMNAFLGQLDYPEKIQHRLLMNTVRLNARPPLMSPMQAATPGASADSQSRSSSS